MSQSNSRFSVRVLNPKGNEVKPASKRFLAARAAIVAVVLAFGAAACSTDSGSDGGTSENADTDALAPLYEGTEGEPPTEGPAAAEGIDVWWVACSMAAPGCSQPAQEAERAAETLGWGFNIADGQFNAGGAWSSSVRTAIAAGPDAIVLQGIPCDAVAQPIAEAVEAEIVVLFVEGVDCEQTDEAYLPSMVYSETAQNTEEFWKDYGRNAGEYLVAASGGETKLINSAGTEGQQVSVDEGLREVLDECDGCEIVDTVSYSSPDLVPEGPWIKAFRSSLVEHPDATSVFFPFDVFSATLGGAKALQDAGMTDVISFGGQGLPEAVDLVHQGSLTAIASARSAGWLAYASLDNLNRFLQGEEPVAQGLGYVVVDAENNLPPEGESYSSDIDWQAAYESIWAG